MSKKIYSIVSIVVLSLSGILLFACSGKVSKNSSDNVENDTINPLENAIISDLSDADTPQSDIDILKYYCWTDGEMIYTYRNTEVDSNNNQITRYFFSCSTVNEKSNALMCIEVDPTGWKSVSPTNDKYYKLIFRDRGKKFNPITYLDPDLTQSVEKRNVGGLGIFMVKQMTDICEYEYTYGCNILTLGIKLSV